MPDRDMTEPKDRITPSQARKRIKERDDKDPNWRSRHYRDEDTVTDEVPAKEDPDGD